LLLAEIVGVSTPRLIKMLFCFVFVLQPYYDPKINKNMIMLLIHVKAIYNLTQFFASER